MAEGGSSYADLDFSEVQEFGEMLDNLRDLEEEDYYDNNYLQDHEEEGTEDMETNCDDDQSYGDIEEMQMNTDSTTERRGRPIGWRKEKEEIPIIRPRERRKEKKEPVNIQDLSSFICCVSLCLATISLAVADTARRNFQQLSLVERSNWVLQWLRDHSRFENGRLYSSFSIGGERVCLKAWITVLNLPRSTFYAILNRHNRGCINIAGPGNVIGRMSSAAQQAMSWLHQFTSDHADKLPDCTKLHLPSCLTKISIYNMYRENFPINSLSLSHFLRLWRETMTHIVIPKRSRFSQCDFCTKIKNKLQETKSKMEKKPLLDYRNEHLKIQNTERRKYYKHSSKAKKHPEKYLSLIIDAMDQRKTSVPNFYTESKSLANTYRLKVNLMAVVAHGIGIYGFFDAFQWSHGASYTLSVLAHCLKMFELLPGVLYLQMDNCYGQNKNNVNIPAMKMHEVYNFQRWLGVNSVKNHSKPHVFKITLNETNKKAEVHYKGLTTDKEWVKPEGNGLLLEEGNRDLTTIPSSTDNIDIDRLRTDLRTVYSYYKGDDLKYQWDSYIDELLEDEEQESQTEDLIAALKTKKRIEVQSADMELDNTEGLDGLPNLKPVIPKVVIGRQEKTATRRRGESEETYRIDTFVVCNFDKYPDEFPQVAKIVSVGETHLELLWFKGAKTTTWKPASRPVKGQRGQREPWKEFVPLSAVWLSDFKLTPLGKLPQHIKDILDQRDVWMFLNLVSGSSPKQLKEFQRNLVEVISNKPRSAYYQEYVARTKK